MTTSKYSSNVVWYFDLRDDFEKSIHQGYGNFRCLIFSTRFLSSIEPKKRIITSRYPIVLCDIFAPVITI